MAFELLIDYRAHNEIDEALEYYSGKSKKAAINLYKMIQNAYDSLSVNPYFETRYFDYRCLPIKKFPYMFHFTVHEKEKIVQIHALINTSKNPDSEWLHH